LARSGAVLSTNRAEPSRPYYTPRESSLLWLRTITTGTMAVRAQRRTRPIRPDPPAKQVVSKTIKSKHPRAQRNRRLKAKAGVQESIRRILARGLLGPILSTDRSIWTLRRCLAYESMNSIVSAYELARTKLKPSAAQK
jgi:hypothetical protein